MLEITIFLIIVALAALFLSLKKKGKEETREGLVKGGRMLWKMAPLLTLAFLLTGFLKVLLPPEVINVFIGEEAGWRGVVLGVIAGVAVASPPYAIFPIISLLYEKGASLSVAVAFIISWSVANAATLAFEIPIMGYKFSVLRVSLTISIPFIAALIIGLR